MFLKIRIELDKERFKKFKYRIIRKVVIKRAYKGHCAFQKMMDEEPCSYTEFEAFSTDVILMCYRQYFALCKGKEFGKSCLNFQSLIFNKA